MSATTSPPGTQKPENSGSSTANSMRETASEIGSEAKNEAMRQAGQLQKTTSESMQAFAQAIRSASDELSNKDQGPAAQLLSHAAGSLEQISNAVGQSSLDDIVGEVRRFGREHPGAFMMGSMLLGIALGRFAQTTVAGSSENQATGTSAGHYEPRAARRYPEGGIDER